MRIEIHPHAAKRATERGADKDEIIITVNDGEEFSAKFNRTGFRKNFIGKTKWMNKTYTAKQIEAYCVKEKNSWLVITVIVKYY